MFAYSYVKANRNMDTEQKPLTSTFSEMRAKILRFAARFFPSEEDAEDALQEAFCRLWCRHPDICSEAEAEAFAKTTVRSIGIDEWRRKQAHPTEPLAADAYADCVDSESADEIFERVQRLIDSCLSPAQQAIIRLHDYEQRGYDEIANRLNMEPAAVRMQLSRARKKIRECYNKQ